MKGYIEQAYKGSTEWWKYIIPIILFFGLMGLNLLVGILLDIDQSEVIKTQIETMGKNNTLITLLIPFLILLLFLFLYVRFVHQIPFLNFSTSRSKFDWKRFFFSFSIISISMIILTLLDVYLRPEYYEFNFEWRKFLFLFLISIILIPIQTSFEEYMFRGYMMQGIGVMAKNRWAPFFITSILFGVIHFANPEVTKLGPIIMISYIGTGFLLGILTLMDEGLELSLGFHAGNNMTIALLVTANWTAFQTESIFIYTGEPSAGFDVFIPVLLFYPIILFIFAKVYKWNNWQQRLFGKVEPPKPVNENKIISHNS